MKDPRRLRRRRLPDPTRDRAGEPRRRLRGFPAVLLLLALGGCRSSEPDEASAAPVVLVSGLQPISPTATPALRALGTALENDEDELARQILGRLKRQPLDDTERELVATYERILVGRTLVDAVRFELTSEAAGTDEVRIVLRLLQETGATLRLRLPPADLGRLQVGVDAQGLEGRDFESSVVVALTDLELPSGVEVEIQLGRALIRPGRAIALRDRWRLTLRSGEILRGGESYPAGRLPRPVHERISLAEEVESDPSTAVELVAAITDTEVAPAEVLLLAVRLPDEERESALRALAPEVAAMAAEDPERLRSMAASLRWVARTREPGADPRHWAAWLDAWSQREREQGPRPQLQLPGRDSGGNRR